MQHGKGQELPKIIPPSPSAMQFQKYGDYPVGHYTGVPDISIPIYTIKEGDIEFPITLSYHASGSKPSDANGYVGMGWSLNCGGQISRTIMDQPDEAKTFPSPFYTVAQLSNLSAVMRDYTIKGWQGNYDTEPDVFSYSFSNHQGKFVLDYNNNQTPLLLPYKPIKITMQSGAFNVLDESGFNYHFKPNELPVNSAGYTSWAIDRLQSATDPTNVLTFTYTGGPIEHTYTRSEMFIGDDQNTRPKIPGLCFGYISETLIEKPMWQFMEYSNPTAIGTNSDISYTGGVISEVSFRSGKVKFIANNDTRMLQRVEIYNSDNSIIKSLDFVYVQKPVNRVLLKEIRLNDRNNQFINNYSFDYIDEASGILYDYSTASIDYWGYYNGTASTVMPNWYMYFNTFGSLLRLGNNLRQSNDLMKTFVLNGITYPTGGKTVFEYEGNKVGLHPDNIGDMVGGLRVKTISNYSYPSATPEVKTYEYEPGLLDVYPGKIEDYSYSTKVYLVQPIELGLWENYRRRFFSSEPTINLVPHGSPVVYHNVTEYVGDGQHNTGKNVYSYSSFSPDATNDYYSYAINGVGDNSTTNKRFSKPFNNWTSGLLLSTEHLKSDGNGNYIPVSADVNEYDFLTGASLRALKTEHAVDYVTDGCSNIYNGDYDGNVYSHAKNPPQCVYNYAEYFYESGEARLKGTVHYDYAGNQQSPIVTETNFEYSNSVHDQVTKKTVITSKNDEIITEYKYPHDFATVEPYATMVNSLHRWSPVVEQVQYKNLGSNPLTSLRTNYSSWSNSIVAPATIEKGISASTYETRLHFFNYDERGNVLTVSKENDLKIGYLWDYNKTLPVAECVGAANDDIAYTSFEADGKGNWSYNGTPVALAAVPTGRKAYTLDGTNPISRTGLNAATTYIVSYWTTQSSALSIAGTFQGYPLKGKQVGNWTFFMHKVSGQTSVQISGSGSIDELRLYPASAQMKTYTYDPLIGTTSECDVNNRIAYYEYDDAQRLYLVRDQDRNVLKEFNYAYSKPVTEEVGVYYNNAASRNVTRNNCGGNSGDYIPPVVTYYVPAYKYKSTVSQKDADAMVTADMDANAQNYANDNNNGKCIKVYYNEEQTRTVRRNSCAAGPSDGGLVTYKVPEHTYSSLTSIDDANARAIRDLDANAQINANYYGSCSYYVNYEIDRTFYSLSCGHNYAPNAVEINVPKGMFTSTISDQDAYEKALAYAQQQANTRGTCTLSAADVSFICPENNTHWIITFTSANQQDTYYFEINGNTSGVLGSIPFGTYTVYCEATYDKDFDVQVGCGISNTGKNQIWVDNVTISEYCNTLSIDDFN
jgi:hypothetical protein